MTTNWLVRLALLLFLFAVRCHAGGQLTWYLYAEVTCDPDSNTLKVYQVSIRRVGKGPTYLSMKEIPSQVTGKPCKYAKQNNILLDHPYQFNSPTYRQKIAKQLRQWNGRDSSTTVSLLDTFPWIAPLPFSPDALPPDTTTSGNCDGSTTLYLINNPNGTISDLSICPLQETNTILVCQDPIGQALTPDGSTLLVSCYDNQIVWVDTSTDLVVHSLATPNLYPAGIAMSPDGTVAYVTNYWDADPAPALAVVNVASRTIVNTIPLPQAFPGVVVLTPDGSQAWVNYYDSNVVDIVDLLSGTPAGHLTFSGLTMNGMAFNPTGTSAYIVTGSNLTVVNTATLKTVATIPLSGDPLDVVVSPDGGLVEVGDYEGTHIWHIDALTNTIIQATTLGGGEGPAIIFGNFQWP